MEKILFDYSRYGLEEMAEHFGLSCNGYSRVRLLGEDIFNLEKMQEIAFPNLMRYVKKTGNFKSTVHWITWKVQRTKRPNYRDVKPTPL